MEGMAKICSNRQLFSTLRIVLSVRLLDPFRSISKGKRGPHSADAQMDARTLRNASAISTQRI